MIKHAEAGTLRAIKSIVDVQAVELKNGKFRLDAVFADGTRESIKQQSTQKPYAVQLYSFALNGNFKGEGVGKFFAFTKGVDSHYREFHIQSFIVA
jgi:hypothetical protein